MLDTASAPEALSVAYPLDRVQGDMHAPSRALAGAARAAREQDRQVAP